MSSSTQARRPAAPPRRRVPLVAILLGVVAVLLVGAIAVNALTKDDDAGSGGEVAQVRAVTVEGTPLERFTEDGADDPAIGIAAPQIDGADFEGNAQSLGGQTGTPTLALFVAHWCPHCQAEVPRVVDWRADGTIPDDIDLVAVSTGVAPERGNYPPSSWLAEEGWPGRVLVDDASNQAAGYYGLPSYPYFVALDADGNVVARARGELDQEAVAAIVDQLRN